MPRCNMYAIMRAFWRFAGWDEPGLGVSGAPGAAGAHSGATLPAGRYHLETVSRKFEPLKAAGDIFMSRRLDTFPLPVKGRTACACNAEGHRHPTAVHHAPQCCSLSCAGSAACKLPLPTRQQQQQQGRCGSDAATPPDAMRPAASLLHAALQPHVPEAALWICSVLRGRAGRQQRRRCQRCATPPHAGPQAALIEAGHHNTKRPRRQQQ